MVRAVPPLATNSTPAPCKAFAKSTNPVLSETESNARPVDIAQSFLSDKAQAENKKGSPL
jgi:hypothetical protein